MIIRISLLHDHFDQDHLEKVIEEMKILGAPTVKVLDTGAGNIIQALECSHRLRAAEILGKTPILEYVSPDNTIGTLGLDQDGVLISSGTDITDLISYDNYQILIEDGKIKAKL